VDWAGVVKPPAANEMGWKETVRMNPLEDIYVAVKAVRPLTPIGVPGSQRLLDPSQGVGSQFNLTQIDPWTGQAPTIQRYLVNGVMTDKPVTAYSNQLTDFDNEYVWHCHILGHEENDFMRPFVFHPFVVTPDAPGNVTLSTGTVTWTDPTPFGGQDAQGIPTAGYDANGNLTNSPKNEIGFRIQQRTGATVNVLATVPANTTSWTDAKFAAIPASEIEVVAFNNAKDSVGNYVGDSVPGTSATTGVGSATNASAANGATLAATAISAAVNGMAGAATTAADAATKAADAAAAAATAQTAADAALAVKQSLSPLNFAAAATPNAATPKGISLTWVNDPANISATGYTNVTGYSLTWLQKGNKVGKASFGAKSRGATVTGLTSGQSYDFKLVAQGTKKSLNSTSVTTTQTAP
jgi:hypothetical protein